MSEVGSHLPLMARKAATILEREFPKLAKQYCPDRQEGFCEMTGGRCKLESCPKMKEQMEKYL